MVHHVETLGDYSTDEWYTPLDPWISGVQRLFGGRIDLDPASNDTAQKWIQARVYWTLKTKIHPLRRNWGNVSQPQKVYCNPPYLHQGHKWVEHATHQYDLRHIADLVLLVRGDSKALKNALSHSDCIWCDPTNRIKFVKPDGTLGESPKPGYKLVYLGLQHDLFYEIFKPYGQINISYCTMMRKLTEFDKSA